PGRVRGGPRRVRVQAAGGRRGPGLRRGDLGVPRDGRPAGDRAGPGVRAHAGGDPRMVSLSCAQQSGRAINRALRALPDGAAATLTEPGGAHNLAVGLTNRISVTILGHAGYYIAGLCDGPDVTVDGSLGWGVAENLMSGSVRVSGNVSECAAASAHGGIVMVA